LKRNQLKMIQMMFEVTQSMEDFSKPEENLGERVR